MRRLTPRGLRDFRIKQLMYKPNLHGGNYITTLNTNLPKNGLVFIDCTPEYEDSQDMDQVFYGATLKGVVYVSSIRFYDITTLDLDQKIKALVETIGAYKALEFMEL